MWRIEQRVTRLNDLGFDVEELDVVTDWDGSTIRLQPRVVELGHHQREFRDLTGLDVEDNQARVLLNDISAYAAHSGLNGEDRMLVANTWLHQFYEPIMAMVPAGDARQAGEPRDLPPDPRAPVVPQRAGRLRADSSTRRATTSPTCCPTAASERRSPRRPVTEDAGVSPGTI